MKKITVFFSLCLGLLLPSFVLAESVERVTDLYGFEVVVLDSTAEARATGIQRGLIQVMIRVSGDKRIATHPAVAGLLSQADKYVQQYGYSERVVEDESALIQVLNETPEQTAETENAEGEAALSTMTEPALQKEMLLSGRFEASALQRALRAAGLPVWDARRPKVLMLNTIDIPSSEGEVDVTVLRQQLLTASRARGLPLSIPEEDGLNASTIWKGDRFALDDAARAAGVDYVHWSRISRQGSEPGWVAEAALYQNGELVREWYFNAAEPSEAVERLVDETADWMAARYAVVNTAGGNSLVGLYVSGIDNVADYAALQKLLKRLGSLQKAELVALGKSTVIYRVTTRSDVRQLEHGLQLSRRLQPDNTASRDLRAPVWLGELELYYRFQ